MNNINLDENFINDIARLIQQESIELIDFDRLVDVLDSLGRELESFNQVQTELNLLKADYCDRILGMLKANLACRPDHDEANWVRLLSEDNLELSCRELIELYRKTAARFRDNFPATFKYPAPRRGQIEKHNWKDHKI